MKLDVVIPAFRDERVLETISSLESCILDDIELRVIVQISNSGNEFADLIQNKFPWVEIGIEHDSGIFDVINIGLKKCDGDLVLTLGSDDRVFNKNCFQLVKQKYLLGARCILTDMQYTDDQWMPIRYWPARRISYANYYLGYQHAHFSLFLSPKIYSEIGYFNQNNSVNSDYEFFWKLTKLLNKRQIKSEIIPVVCVQMKLGGNSSRSVKRIVGHQMRLLKFAFKEAPGLIPAILIFKWFHKVKQFLLQRTQ